MIRTVQLAANRYDIFTATTGKYIGSADNGVDGVFRWTPLLSIYDLLEASTLHAIANFLDSVNVESTKPE